tara:strand:- start:373 stop:1254 length:882 start_codon:yes stop_codon:yes gene_type:complete
MVISKNILITGSKGQLGSSLRKISKNYNHNFIFTDKIILDITNSEMTEQFFKKNKIDAVVNCAAFTNVENAEFMQNQANTINNKAVSYLANICSEHNIQLIHISTDYVFDGNQNISYRENDIANPLNYYGKTKLNGENEILKCNLKNSAIIRTSWLYSESENNFVSKILNKINSGSEVCVVSDEIGSPTNSMDLAKTILDIIPKINNDQTEIYNFSNIGFCSRFEFATEIKNIMKSKVKVIPYIRKETGVIRPKFSPLDTSKILKSFKININTWESSLENHLLKNNIVHNYEV